MDFPSLHIGELCARVPIIQGGMAWVAEYHLAAGLTEMCSCTLQHSDSSRMYLMRQSRK